MAFQNSYNNKLVQGLTVELGGDAEGDLYYRNAAGELTRLAKGTPGDVLKAGTNVPEWGAGSSVPSGNAGGDLSGTYPNPSVAARAITFAKMQAIATAQILGRISAGSGDIEELSATQLAAILALGTAAYLDVGTGANQIPQLDSNGLLPSSIVPAIALNSTQVVADQAARLALNNVQVGDLAKQTDNGITYILSALPASADENWVSIGDTTIVASDIVSGLIATARLGSGTANASSFLRGDQTWQPAPFVPMPYTNVTGTTQAIAPNNGYRANNAARVTLTLPAIAAVGTQISILGIGAGGWRIAQNAGQSIVFGSATTTSGTGGRIDSTHPRDSIRLVCIEADTVWQVESAIGNLEVI